VKILEETLDGIVVERPKPTEQTPQNLCADAAYKGKEALAIALERLYTEHIKQRREEAEAKHSDPTFKARRWVVERTHSWFNRFRKLLVSFEKKKESFEALMMLAAAQICWRQTIIIYG
jgi:transposase